MIYLAVVSVIFIGELFLKSYIEKHQTEETDTPILKGKIIIRKYHNKGAFLNAGQKHTGLVAAVSLLFTAMMLAVFLGTLTRRGNVLLKAGLSILLGGAFSNTYDRVRRGYVVDYFSFSSKSAHMQGIVFNISDFCIAIGAAITAIWDLRRG